DIYSYFPSSTECLNLSNHITFVRASLACLGISGSGGGIQDRATFNHQHFRLVNESKNRFSHSFYFQRSVFVTSQSRLSHGEKVVNAYFCHSFRQRNSHCHQPINTEKKTTQSVWLSMLEKMGFWVECAWHSG